MIAALTVLVVVMLIAAAVLAVSRSGGDDSVRVNNERQARNAAEVGVKAAMVYLGSISDDSDEGGKTIDQYIRDVHKGAAQSAEIDRSCYRFYFVVPDAGPEPTESQKVETVIEAQSPKTENCAPDDAAGRGHSRIIATMSLSPQLLNYALAGDDLYLGGQ